MAKLSIVLPDSLTDMEIERRVLAPLNANITVGHCRTEDEVVAMTRDADALMVHWVRITRQVIEQLTRCRIITRFGVGVEIIDLAAAREHGIHVANVPAYCTEEVASQALTYLLVLGRRIHMLDRLMHQGLWTMEGIGGLPARLRRQTLGLVGLGRIGRRVAQFAAPVGIRILGYDVQPPEDPGTVTLTDLETLLRESDYVSLHCPLTAETRHLINAEAFRKMKPTSFLINVARGGVVDTTALIEALAGKQIAGAALDVYEEEPLPAEHPLRKMENVILTPHTAAQSPDALVELREGAARNVLEFFQSNPN